MNKIFFTLLFISFSVLNAQEHNAIQIDGNKNNSIQPLSFYNIQAFTPLKKNNSVEVLDSLIYISTMDDRNRIAYNYNDVLLLNYFTRAAWYNGEWITIDKHTNTYNSDGNIESVLWESLNTPSNEWINVAKDVYNYDSAGNRIFSLYQSFYGQEFVNRVKNESYYDTENNLVSSVSQHWIDSIWVINSRLINIINADNLTDTTLIQFWLNPEWINYQLSIYKYDENHNRTTVFIKRWQEEQWIDHAFGRFEYDVNNNLVLDNWQIALNNNWENWFRIFYAYNSQNNLIHLFGEEWVNNQWIQENEPLRITNPDGFVYVYLAKEIFLYYSKPTSVESEKYNTNGFNLFQNYPNPFNPVTNIRYQVPKSGLVELKVFDLLGREVAVLVNEIKSEGSYSIIFNAGNLPSGVYIYSLRANEYFQNNKMILLK